MKPDVFAFLAPVIFVAWSMCYAPVMTRPRFFFAVTVAPGFWRTPQALQILRRYRIEVIAVSALALGGGAVALRTGQALFFTAGILCQGVGSIAAAMRAHRFALAYGAPRSGVRQALLVPRRDSLPGGPAAWAGPFAALGAAAAYLKLHWNQIPQRFPIHWGFDGRPNGWATRTFGGVYGALLFGAGICALFLLMSYGVLRSSRGDAGVRRATLRLLLGVQYFMALLFCWAATSSLRIRSNMPGTETVIVLVTPLALVVLVIWLLARQYAQSNQEQFNMRGYGLGIEQPAADSSRDRCWKLGLFYYNPDDSALFIEKRFGVGYDINFANRWAWIFFAVLAGSIALPFLLH